MNIALFQYFQLTHSRLNLPSKCITKSQMFFVTLPHIDTGSFLVPLMASADHIQIYSTDFLKAVLTLCFQEIQYLKVKDYFLKIRMLDGNVHYIDFAYKFVLQRFLTECIQKRFIKSATGIYRAIFKHGHYYPREKSKFYI